MYIKIGLHVVVCNTTVYDHVVVFNHLFMQNIIFKETLVVNSVGIVLFE